MKIEVRAALPEEMNEARRVAAETNVLPPGFIPPEFINGITHDMTLCAFVDGKLATSYASWPFKMKFNGMEAPVSGVSFVGTLPVFRRMGCLGKIHKRHFELLYEQGERSINILFASHAAIYQRYGYAVVSTQNSYEIGPEHIRFRSMEHLNKNGRLIQLRENEAEILDRIYSKFIEHRTGYLLRDKFKWETGALNPPIDTEIVHDKIVYEEKGIPLGYVVYTVSPYLNESGLVHLISIKDMAWLSISAYYGIWNYFKNMDLALNIHWPQMPQDDPAPYLLLEPRDLNIKSGNGFLARIVDVEKAVPMRRYSEEGELVFKITDDDTCPWNNGIWHMEAAGGNASIKKTKKSPQITMSVNTLAMILFGQVSTTEAARMGVLNVTGKDTAKRCDRLFRTEYRPFCCDII